MLSRCCNNRGYQVLHIDMKAKTSPVAYGYIALTSSVFPTICVLLMAASSEVAALQFLSSPCTVCTASIGLHLLVKY